MLHSLNVNDFVYVIAMEQPWVNYYGTIVDIEGDMVKVETEEGEVSTVNKKQVTLAD